MAAPSIALNGSLDRVDPDGAIEGWCWSPDEPDRRRDVVVLVDGVEVTRLRCDRARADLAGAGIGDGRHAFLAQLDPAAMLPGAAAQVGLRDAASGQSLGAPRKVVWAAAPRPVAPPGQNDLHGTLDRVSRDGWLSGWCWYPADPARHVELAVLVDDQPVGTTLAALFRPDLQQAGIGDGSHGFAYALPYSALADKGAVTVAVQERATGRPLGDKIVVRLGRMAATEARVLDLERELRLLRGQIGELARAARDRDEERAARDLFAMVGGFFQELAQGGRRGMGLAAALDDMMARHPPLTLATPAAPAATLCVAATADAHTVYRCLAALHETGIDTQADIVLLDANGAAALLPSVVRNLDYRRLHHGAGLIEGRNEAARTARGAVVVFLAPQARPAAGWLDELLATLAREPQAALVAGRAVRPDGLLEAFGLLADDFAQLHDPGRLALAETAACSFLRQVDAVAGHGFAVRRADLLAAGGFSALFTQFGHAAVDISVKLRAAGRAVLVQPLATAVWHDSDAPDSDAPNGDRPDSDPPDSDAAAPDLGLRDEQTLRLRERLRAEGWPVTQAAGGFVGHALVIDDGLPHPDRDAGSIAAWEQMQVLRRLGWRVTLWPLHAEAPAAADLDRLRRAGIEVAGPPDPPSLTVYLQDHGAALDLVHVYRHHNMAMLHERIRELAPQAKLVFATADLHFLREQRRAELAGQPAPEAARADELACIRAADAAIVTSDYERDLLLREPEPGNLVLLRWIVRPEPAQPGFDARDGVCFVGNFRHPPNLDGVLWFLADVWPLVQAARPGLRLRLAGSDMPPQLRAMASETVAVLGWVEDLAGLFAAARLSVAPLRYGAGFKGKLATSLAHGLPAVGSAISLEGTGLADGDGVLQADDPEAFAAAILRLHDDAALWRTLSARGLDRVAALYSPHAAEAVWRGMLHGFGLAAR